MKKTVYLLLPFIAASLFLASCSEDDNGGSDMMPTADIVGVAQANGYTSLAAALTAADLVDDLQGDGPFTVFAPTDAAFATLLSDLGVSGLDEIAQEDLIEILTYHVVAAEVYSKDIAAGDVTTLNGSAVTLAVDGGITVNGVAVESPYDVPATNGVIHTIGTVLVPEGFELSPTKDIVETAVDAGFNSLAAALGKADLIAALQGDGPFTVFAPTDEAFAALLETIGQESIEDVPASVLAEILKYHVVAAEVYAADVTAGDVATLEGTNITLATEGGVTVNGANVTATDVAATNGVIHVIDEVLVPESVMMFVNTVLEPAYFSEDFTTLIEAAVKADVVGTILAADALTIFAPTNTAFADAGVVVADLDAATLATVLKYHVVGAKVLSSGIPSDASTLEGSSIYFSLTDGGNFINGSTEITAVDIESGTGVVHVIDNVLMPPVGDVVALAQDLSDKMDGEFSSLIAALTAADLVTTLQGDGPFTVFAPTNAAFQELLDSNADWTELSDIPVETLTTVLTYHVVPARAYSVDLAGAVDANNGIATVEGSSLTFDLSALTIDGTANITGVNYHASNGVIHVIDEVVLP
ncbi:fasciclin domain-containing protein [Reichenbachiella ulvae]|uniref:Fasciclin domain-containing protein n=1 Tax=Reichenbachiella ulvae TaxID=2980104 RepID=A0ABT3CX41_9BACT|nr:fasciclin domain-containing protein [Reichenbachiella ulvae]MCV9387778.1 fasciclin domain-containing protein [Reichenbachiella ulvae]